MCQLYPCVSTDLSEIELKYKNNSFKECNWKRCLNQWWQTFLMPYGTTRTQSQYQDHLSRYGRETILDQILRWPLATVISNRWWNYEMKHDWLQVFLVICTSEQMDIKLLGSPNSKTLGRPMDQPWWTAVLPLGGSYMAIKHQYHLCVVNFLPLPRSSCKTSYPKISWSIEGAKWYLKFPNYFKIWHVAQQQCCQYYY